MKLFEDKFHVGGNNVIIGEQNRDVQALNNRTIYYVDIENAETALASVDIAQI